MALLSIVPTYLLCRELGVRLPAANLAVFLAAVNPFLIRNGQGLRMYSMLLLLGMWSLWLVFRFCRTAPGSSRGPLVALTCVNLLMVYTHYLGWILIALEGAVVIAEARPKVGAFLVSTLCVGAGFAPWAAFVAIRSRPSVGLAEDVRQHLRWIERPDWRDVVSYFARLNGAFREGLGSAKVKVLVGFALFDLPLVLAFRNRARIAGIDAADAPSRRGSRALAWLAFFTAVPVAIALVVSHLLPFSIFGPRYLILSSIPYLILCAVGLVSVQPKVLRSVAIAAAMGWAVFGFVEEVRLVGRTDWFFLVGEMRRVEPEPQGPVDVFSLTSQSPVRYALQRDPDPRFRIRSRIAHVNEIDGPRFWLAFQESVAYPEETRALLHALEEKGYRRVHCLESGSPQNRMHLDRFVRSPGSAAPESLGPGSSP
jgi:hypothetical protein